MKKIKLINFHYILLRFSQFILAKNCNVYSRRANDGRQYARGKSKKKKYEFVLLRKKIAILRFKNDDAVKTPCYLTPQQIQLMQVLQQNQVKLKIGRPHRN